MNATDPDKKLVFISHSATDRQFADQFEGMLRAAGYDTWNFNTAMQPGDVYLGKARPALEACAVIAVLIGPLTRNSRFVDMEMEVALESGSRSARAQLLGIILPHHPDWKNPWYEPELVPIRVHELVLRGAADLHKWSDDPSVAGCWIRQALARADRSTRNVRPSLSALRYFRGDNFSNEGDVEREGLSSLSHQHPMVRERGSESK